MRKTHKRHTSISTQRHCCSVLTDGPCLTTIWQARDGLASVPASPAWEVAVLACVCVLVMKSSAVLSKTILHNGVTGGGNVQQQTNVMDRQSNVWHVPLEVPLQQHSTRGSVVLKRRDVKKYYIYIYIQQTVYGVCSYHCSLLVRWPGSPVRK